MIQHSSHVFLVRVGVGSLRSDAEVMRFHSGWLLKVPCQVKIAKDLIANDRLEGARMMKNWSQASAFVQTQADYYDMQDVSPS